jgi:hypothetical protein
MKGWQSGRGPPPLIDFGGTFQGQAPPGSIRTGWWHQATAQSHVRDKSMSGTTPMLLKLAGSCHYK